MDREFTQTIETYGNPFSVSSGKEAEEAFKTRNRCKSQNRAALQ